MRRSIVPGSLFVLLLAFWLLLSDQYRPLFVLMGIASAATVTALTTPLVRSALSDDAPSLGSVPLRMWYAAAYAVWLVGRIVVAGSQVAWIVLNPRVPIQPGELHFRAGMRSRLGRVMLANTITLVPGTLTLRLEEDEYVVHALVPQAADELIDGRMPRMIGRIFLEEVGPAIDPQWHPAREVHG